MKAETRLDKAVFQLTPTRTRCELVIIANEKTERLASGLLNPFLTHLKIAQDQIAKGGYSVTLEPDPQVDAVWFTKDTVERFVRFVSTPEVLERVSTIESEILQIEEAINIQGKDNVAISMVGEGQRKLSGSNEGMKSKTNADIEKAIILYKPGTNPPDSNGSSAQEENSKVQLLRVLETRKMVLQKEQAMAFARAVAAGFDMDHMAYLISFAESFGASRLKEACLRFMELWKAKHETGQWIELDAVDALSSKHEFSAFTPSGVVLSGDHTDTWSAPGADGEANDGRLPSDPQMSGPPHDYSHGQFRHPAFPQWPMHSGLPVFPPYPMQGMPYYPNYPSPPYFQSAYPPPEDPRFTQQRIGKRHSADSKDSAVDSEVNTRSPEGGGLDISEEGSQDLESHKRGSHSGKKKPGVVVIRNINYITSKRRDKSDSDTSSASESEDDGETGSDTTQKKHEISSKSSRRKGDKIGSSHMSDMHEKDNNVEGLVAEAGNWDVFQTFLLKAEEKNQSSYDKGLFGDEKEPPIRRKLSKGGADPILPFDRNLVDGHESRMVEVDSFNGSTSRMRKLASNDGFLLSSGGRSEVHFDEQFKEVEGGGRGYRRTESDDFIVRGQDNQAGGKSKLDHLAENEYRLAGRLEKGSYYDTTDESFVIPLRTNTNNQLDRENRTDIYMDSELPSSTNDASSRVKNQIIYEPDELSMLPEREVARETIGYDPSMDYDLQVAVGDVLTPENADQTENSVVKKEDNKKLEKKPKATQDDKRKMELLSRRGKMAKANPLTEAQKRAEKLRAFKADLQKVKKEKEEEEIKRLEALKRERQKRIAARNNSNNVQSPLTPKKPEARVSAKASPSSYKGSKFSDSEPGSSSPLQRLPVRTASGGSQNTTKTSRLSGRSQQAESELSRSASSLSDLRREPSGVNGEAKVAALRRLSEPKHINVPRGSSLKSSNDHSVKKSIVNESQAKKVSAIMHLDKTKSAALPELKIRSPKSSVVVQKKATTKEPLGNGIGTSGKTKETHKSEETLHLSSGEDNPVVEKTVVMLEKEVVLPNVVQPSEEMFDARNRTYWDNGRAKSEFVSEYAAIRAPPSGVDVSKDSNGCSAITENSFEMVPNFLKDESGGVSTDDKSYHAPFARATSLEDRANSYTERKEEGPVVISKMGTVTETNITYVPNIMDANHNEKIHEKFPNKESTKGLLKLLKFGKKGHSSASSERCMDSTVDELAGTASSKDVHLLKNLISQDDPQVGGTPPKASRSFSLLSPFRNKTSDKKQAA